MSTRDMRAHARKISDTHGQVEFTRAAIVDYLADAEPWSDATLRAMVAAYKQYRAEYRADVRVRIRWACDGDWWLKHGRLRSGRKSITNPVTRLSLSVADALAAAS